MHHPKKATKTTARNDAAFKAEQEKHRREEAIAQTTGLRVLNAIVEAVPVRLMKRDLLFVVERLAGMLDERRLSIVLRQNGIGKVKESESISKMLAAFIHKSDESTLGRLLVETVILHLSANDPGKALRQAADYYKVDVDAITAKVKQEFAAKEKAKVGRKPVGKTPPKGAKKSAAA